MGRSKHSKQSTKARIDERQAVELRKTGATYQQIADNLGCSEASARRAVKRAVARLIKETQEDTEEMRRLESDRLDAMLVSIWPRVRKGEVFAIDRALKIHSARSRLFGLDIVQQDASQAPTIVQYVNPWRDPDDE